jgi:hypothetical protein
MQRTTAVLITAVSAASLFLLARPDLSPAAEMADHPSDFPDGCVGCHVAHDGDAGPDMRLNVLLKDIGHISVDKRVDTVPTDCLDCHEDDEEPTFAQRIHMVHFAKPDENDFVQTFNGDCRHCHQVDADTGEVSLKEASKNW